MDCIHYTQLLVLLKSVTVVSGWQYFTTYDDLVHESSAKEVRSKHSEYMFGECKRKDIRLYTSTYLDHSQILGKVIVRGWLDILRIPTCIRLRAYSHSEDQLRNTAYRFQICVPRITYCHSRKRTKYFYYEWYIPEDMSAGMNWVMYFYGVRSMSWGDI